MDKIKLTGFLSYAHKNTEYSELFLEGLKNQLKHSKYVEVEIWDDSKIPLGADWLETITKQIEKSDFAILLVSSSFLSSEFIENVEFRSFIKRKKDKGFKFYTVVLSSLDISQWEELSKTQFFTARGIDYGFPYVGIDVVPSIIEQNRARYANRTRSFFASDITGDFLPECDLILCRDCLVHLSFAEISAALFNFCGSGAKYLLTTTFPKTKANVDIQTGDWRRLNFQLAPFNFPPPLVLLNERCTEGNGKYADKSLGLWDISELSALINDDGLFV